MAERCDESSRLDSCSTETKTDHEERREDQVNAEVPSNPKEKTEVAEAPRFDVSCLTTANHMETNTEHQFPHTESSSVDKEVKPASEVLQKNHLFLSGASHEASLTENDCKQFSLIDNNEKLHSLNENSKDFLTQSTSETCHKEDSMQCGEDVELQKLVLHHPEDQTTSHQTVAAVGIKENHSLYHSVLHQMQQQQKNKRGRKFKKRTLMKMAKLFVIARGLESEATQTSDVKNSNGSLAELLNKKEETSISLVSSQSDTVEANNPHVRGRDCDSESLTVSGQTLVLMGNNETSSTREKELSLCGAAESLLDEPDKVQEPLLYSTSVTVAEKQRNVRKMVSVAFRDPSCDSNGLSRNRPAEISEVDPQKKPTSKRRTKTNKGSKAGEKKGSKQEPLPETFTERNDEKTLFFRGGYLVPDSVNKNETEATCSEEPSKSPEAELKSKRKVGRPCKKQTSAKKTGDSKQSKVSKGDVLSQAAPRGQQKKKKTISTSCGRKSPGTKRLKLKSSETVATPVATVESLAALSSLVLSDEAASFHTGNQVCATQITEDQTTPSKKVKRARKKGVAASRSTCQRAGRAVQQLPTEEVSLQEQSEPDLREETSRRSTLAVAMFTKSGKRGARTKTCKAETVDVPVFVPWCDYSATNQSADIKTEAACEPVTLTLTKRGRPRRKSVQKGRDTLTINVPLEEESGDLDQKQQLQEETVLRSKSDRKHKDTGERRSVEHKAKNCDLNIKSEPVWDVAPTLFPLTVQKVETELDETYSTHKERKRPRKCTNPQPEDSLKRYLKGSQVGSLPKRRRTNTVQTEMMVNETLTAETTASVVENNETSSTREKELSLCGAAESLLDEPDKVQEPLLYSTSVTVAEKQRNVRKMVSVAFRDPSCDSNGLSRNRPAEISEVDPQKKPTSKRRTKTNKGSKAGEKKGSKQEPLLETFTESNDEKTLFVREGFLVPDSVNKNETEATCSEEPSKSPEAELKSKRKVGRPCKKQTSAKKTGDSKQSKVSKGDVLSQAAPRGQQKKKKTISTSCGRKSPGTKRLKLKSSETVATPVATVESLAALSSLVLSDEAASFHTGNQVCATQITEDKTTPSKKVKRARKKRVAASRSTCQRAGRAVQQLPTEEVSLQEQSEPDLREETSRRSTLAVAMFTKSGKCGARTKTCKAETVDVPVFVPWCDYSATNQSADIKTEAACEPVTLTLTKRGRPRRKSVQKGRDTLTINVPLEEESGDLDQKQQLQEETVLRSKSDRKHKDTGERRSVEHKAKNCDLNIKSEPVWDVAPTTSLCGAAESLLDEPDKVQEPLLYSTSVTVAEKQRNVRKMVSVAFRDPSCDSNGLSRNRPAEISEVDPQKKPTSKRRTKTTKGSKAGEKKGSKQEPLLETFTESNDEKTLFFRGGFLVPDSVNKNETEATCSEEPSKSPEAELKSKRKVGRPCKKQTSAKKTGDSKQSKVSKGDVLSQAAPRGQQKKKKTISSLPKRRRTNNVETEMVVKETAEINAGIPDEDRNQANQDETVKEDQAKLDKMKKPKSKRKYLGVRRCSKVASLVEEGPTAGDVQSGTTAASLFGNVSKNIQRKRGQKRKGKTRKLASPEGFGALNPPVPSFIENLKEDVIVKSKRTTRRVKSDLCTVSAAETHNHIKLEPEDNVSTSSGLQTQGNVTSVTTRRGNKRRNTTTSSRHTPVSEVVVSDLKNVPIPLDVNCEAASEQLKCDTGEHVNREGDNKSKKRSTKRKTCARSPLNSDFVELDINAVKQGHSQTLPAAVPERKPTKKRPRKKRAGWSVRRNLKQPLINAPCSSPADEDMFAFLPESSPRDLDEEISLKDETEDKQSSSQADNSDVKLAANTTDYVYHQKFKPQKLLQCSFCRRSFRHITAFTAHKRIHTGEKPYRCPTCGKNFAQHHQLNQHLKIHSEPREARCPCCGAGFRNKDEVIAHFHIHMKDIQSSDNVNSSLDSLGAQTKPFRCLVCLKNFINKATFRMHQREHGGKLHACSVCGKKFQRTSNLSAHEKTHWPVKPYSCSVCCKGFFKLRELKSHSQTHTGLMAFSCPPCEMSFSSLASLHSHQVAKVCSDKHDGNLSGINGFLVSPSAEGQVVTPVYFKCPICKRLHRHWCQYVLHLQTHTQGRCSTCETCRQRREQADEIGSHCLECCRRSGEERACRSSLTEIWKEAEALETQGDQGVPPDEDQTGRLAALPQMETHQKDGEVMQSPPPSPDHSNSTVNEDLDISASPPASQQPSRFPARSSVRRYCGRFSCGRCGKTFNQWNKLWLHQRFHRQLGRRFSCTHCDLEFRFLGSYMDHLQEHTAQTPYACPLCSEIFADSENISIHISECHKQLDNKKCNTCGKTFSTLRNLKKHKLLHRGAKSHYCLCCNLSFSSSRALKGHLKAHRTRLIVPQPAGLVEPLLFPYQCNKCTAKFSSTDLLQAHQVCHFTAGKKQDRHQDSIVSCIPSRAPEDSQEVVAELSLHKRRLPVSNKKHLFRYPHPDRLYVVPVLSSEPPVVISDTEEESPHAATSQPGATLNIPQSSTRSSTDHENLGFNVTSVYDSDSPELTPHRELMGDAHSCAVCMETFSDISKLHEHYILHATGV